MRLLSVAPQPGVGAGGGRGCGRGEGIAKSRHGTRMNHALLFIGGLLVAVLSALFAVPHFVDWNGYRGVFEEEASRVLGREVRVGGAVNVRLLPTPYVRFEKVRVADATGGTGEPFFRADAFTLRLSVPPLLRGVLEANEIELMRPRLNLSANAEGRGSWTTLNRQPGLAAVRAGRRVAAGGADQRRQHRVCHRGRRRRVAIDRARWRVPGRGDGRPLQVSGQDELARRRASGAVLDWQA